VNPQVHNIEGKERKINKSTTRLCNLKQSDEDLHHLNTSKMFNSVRTTVYYTPVVCYRAQSKGEKENKKRRKGS